MTNSNPLKSLCTPDNFIRSTPYSDVYRAYIKLDEINQFLDIEHIQIPFNPERAELLMKQYHMAPGELAGYYAALARNIRNSITFVDRIRKDAAFLGDEPENNLKCIVEHLYHSISKNEQGGTDIFIVTPPMTRYLNSPRFCYIDTPGSEIAEMHFTSLLNMFHRLLLTIHHANRANAHFGVIDLDSICLVQGTDQKTGEPKDFMTITSCLYARYEDESADIPYPEQMPFNTHPRLLHGGRPCLETDIYSWAAVFLTVLNGTFATNFPDPSIRPKDCVPQDLVNILYAALDGPVPFKDLRRVIRETKKKPFAGMEDKNNFYVRFYVSQPDYLGLKAKIYTLTHPVPAPAENMAPEAPGLQIIPEDATDQFEFTEVDFNFVEMQPQEADDKMPFEFIEMSIEAPDEPSAKDTGEDFTFFFMDVEDAPGSDREETENADSLHESLNTEFTSDLENMDFTFFDLSDIKTPENVRKTRKQRRLEKQAKREEKKMSKRAKKALPAIQEPNTETATEGTVQNSGIHKITKELSSPAASDAITQELSPPIVHNSEAALPDETVSKEEVV